MYPVIACFRIYKNHYCVSSYGLCLVAAVLCGTVISMFMARRIGRGSRDIFTFSMLVAATGFIGAAAAGFIIFIPERIAAGFFTFPPVLVSWGGIISSMAALLLISRKWGENAWQLADLFTPGGLIALGIGRIGCVCAGCCYGIHTDSPFGIYFTCPLAPASVMEQPLVPVQIISACFLLFSGITGLFLLRRARRPGGLFLWSVVAYTMFRFIIEFFRADPRAFLLGLSDGQWFSVVAFAVCAYMIFKKRNYSRDYK